MPSPQCQVVVWVSGVPASANEALTQTVNLPLERCDVTEIGPTTGAALSIATVVLAVVQAR